MAEPTVGHQVHPYQGTEASTSWAVSVLSPGDVLPQSFVDETIAEQLGQKILDGTLEGAANFQLTRRNLRPGNEDGLPPVDPDAIKVWGKKIVLRGSFVHEPSLAPYGAVIQIEKPGKLKETAGRVLGKVGLGSAVKSGPSARIKIIAHDYKSLT